MDSFTSTETTFFKAWEGSTDEQVLDDMKNVSDAFRTFKTKPLENKLKLNILQNLMVKEEFAAIVRWASQMKANLNLRINGAQPTAKEDTVDKDDAPLGSSMDKLSITGITNEAPASSSSSTSSSSTSSSSTSSSSTIAKLADNTMSFQAVSSIDGAALSAKQVYPFRPPVTAMEAYSKVVKTNTALAVIHVEGNRTYDATKPSDVAAFSRLVLSGGNHSFKVVMRPALKGGTPKPTRTTDDTAVFESLMGGTSQCMAFYKGMRYPVILDKECALQVIQLGEEQVVNGLHLGLSLAEQAAVYKDQLRMISSAVLKEDKGTRSIEAAAASIGTTEEQMTGLFFMSLSSLLKLKEVPNDDGNGFLFLDGVVQDRGETPQFNIASNGKMLPGCVSLVMEKSSTLREVLQEKNLTVPEDCKVLGAGVPVGFGLDTPFGDIVTKDMTINLVVRLRGGGVPAPIGGTFRGATQLGLPDPAECADRLEFSVDIFDTTDRDHVLAMWDGQHFPLRSSMRSFLKGMRMCLTMSNTNRRGLYEEQLRKMVFALRLYGEDLEAAAASVDCSVTEMAQAFFGYITQLWAIKALPADENHGFFFVDRR